MLTQQMIDGPEQEKEAPGWFRKFFRRALAVGPKEPKLCITFTEDEWQFIAASLDLLAEDNAEVIGSFGDEKVDADLGATAERAWKLAARIKERVRA